MRRHPARTGFRITIKIEPEGEKNGRGEKLFPGPAAQGLERPDQLGGQGALPRTQAGEGEPGGVEEEAAEPEIAAEPAVEPEIAVAVVAQERMADGGEVRADLVW